jgi:hypothetical protein
LLLRRLDEKDEEAGRSGGEVTPSGEVIIDMLFMYEEDERDVVDA